MTPTKRLLSPTKEMQAKKRRLYLRDPTCTIPRQTTWYQSKKSKSAAPVNPQADILDFTPSLISSSLDDPLNNSTSSLSSLEHDNDQLNNSTSSLSSLEHDNDPLNNSTSSLSSLDDPLNNPPANQAATPLYPGAPISCENSWAAIYKFSVSNHLTDSATTQVLHLITSHCRTPNSCPHTLYKLRSHLGCVENVTNMHYCSVCMNELHPTDKRCTQPTCKSSQQCHMTILPFEERLKEIFTDNWSDVQYPFTRDVHTDCIQDIQDGKRYQKLSQPGQFLSVPEHTGLILCTDGVPLFKSSGQSLWPVQLCITSLPPGIRMNAKYILLAGVWLGPVKPLMSVLLQPILKKIHGLYTTGIPLPTRDGSKMLKAMLFAAVFDLPAKAMALNFTQYNGYYGCSYCLDPGLHISNRHLYPPTGLHTPRFERTVIAWAQEAETTGIPKYGVKGISELSPYLNIIKGVPIDYMHAVLEGVARSLLTKFWFNSKCHGKQFYIGTEIKMVDKMLCRIKPPHEFRRSPRPIGSSVKHWKASEFRAWLLFYAIPIAIRFLPPDYVHHLCLLVCSMHILLSDSITNDNLQKAKRMLEVFYSTIPKLYPQEACTSNIHSLIHLCESVQACGPLWSYSCFGFENMNGYLKKSCHGTGNVLPQLIRNVLMKQKEAQPHNDSGDGARGRIIHQDLSDEHVTILRDSNYHIPHGNLPVFPRYKLGNVTFQYWNDRRLRDSSICKFKQENGDTAFGSIRCFCYCDGNTVAIIANFGPGRDALEVIRPPNIAELNLSEAINRYVIRVTKLSIAKQTVAVPTTSIIAKCVHVPIKGEPYDYIVTMPNTFEHH